jgi:hypothetical protein
LYFESVSPNAAKKTDENRTKGKKRRQLTATLTFCVGARNEDSVLIFFQKNKRKQSQWRMRLRETIWGTGMSVLVLLKRSAF